jgi:hypothetical protein
MSWDGEFCTIKRGPGGKCPEGTFSAGDHCHKRPVSRPFCPEGYKWENTQCVMREPPRCLPGYSFEDGECMVREKPKCSPGMKLVRGICQSDPVPPVCPSGTTSVGQLCVSVREPICEEGWFDGEHCVTGDAPICEDGVHIGQECVTPRQPLCPEKTTFEGSRCVSDQTPRCPAKTFPDGDGACITPSISPCVERQPDSLVKTA